MKENLFWHHHKLNREDREKRAGHKGAVVWFTGLSGSGKSTLAREVEGALFEKGVNVYLLDGDNLRHGLMSDLGFSAADRSENIRRAGEAAKLFFDAGFIVLVAFISPFRADRDRVRAGLPEGRFIETHLSCPLPVCEARDPKGLYKKARAGELKDFTGLDSPYEIPLNPELSIDTSLLSLEEEVEKVLAALSEKGLLGH